MKKLSPPVKIHSAFEKMEIENSLFELTYKNKYAVWDLCRREIFMEINRILLNKPQNLSYDIRPLDKYKNIFKKIYNQIILHLIKLKKARILVVTFRFFKDKNIKYDFVIDPIASELDDIYYLDFANSSLLKSIFFSKVDLPSFKVIRESYNDIDSLTQNIDQCISKIFNIDFASKNIVNYNLNVFFSGKLFFSDLIEGLKCQKVIYSDNGSLKCLSYVCKMKKITCFEVQHGGSPGSIMWTYPDKKKLLLNKSNCYYPDYFLLWGDYWKKIYNIPSKFLVTGTYHFIDKFDHLDHILFISNKSNYVHLSIIAKDIANALPNRKILFKLHPEQFRQYFRIKADFKIYENVQVIANEINDLKLLMDSSDFVTIRSSLAYKALQSGCRGHILKQDNYKWDLELLKFTHQFSSSNELLVNLEKASPQSLYPIFYEKIHINILFDYL